MAHRGDASVALPSSFDFLSSALFRAMMMLDDGENEAEALQGW